MNFIITRPLLPYDHVTVRQEWKFRFGDNRFGELSFKLVSYAVSSRKTNKSYVWLSARCWHKLSHPDAQKLREEPFLSEFDRRMNHRVDHVPLPDDVVQEAKQKLIEQISQIQVEMPKCK